MPIQMRPVITGIHCDFAMHQHVVQWMGPGGHYPGGWCLCAHRGTITLENVVSGSLRQVCSYIHDSSHHLVR
jgi:hypothetical protein